MLRTVWKHAGTDQVHETTRQNGEDLDTFLGRFDAELEAKYSDRRAKAGDVLSTFYVVSGLRVGIAHDVVDGEDEFERHTFDVGVIVRGVEPKPA